MVCTDVTVGSWMLAFNVTHLDDRRLCQVSAASVILCTPLPGSQLHLGDMHTGSAYYCT